MSMRSLKIISAVLISASIFTMIDAKKVKTKKLQIVVNPQVASFAMNVGDGGFVTDLFATRPFGATYLLNGIILPGGTVSKKQSSYLVDKHHHSVTSKSIGTWWCYGQVLEDLDFSNLTPLIGEVVELITWSFLFDKHCDGEDNDLYSNGKTKIKVNSLDQTSFAELMCLTVGTGCNVDPDGNNYTAVIYFDENFVQLIKIKFNEDIEYES
jgi:hypothetical protein